MNTLLDYNRIQLANHESTLKEIDTTEAISRTLLSQIRLDSAQSAENDRTIFAYLDNVLTQNRNITENQERIIDLLENLNTTTTDK